MLKSIQPGSSGHSPLSIPQNSDRQTSAATVRKPIGISAPQNLGIEPESQPLCTVKHSITRYRITLEAFHVTLGGTSSTSPHSKQQIRDSWNSSLRKGSGFWQTPAQMRPDLAFTAAHKKLASLAANRILSGR